MLDRLSTRADLAPVLHFFGCYRETRGSTQSTLTLSIPGAPGSPYARGKLRTLRLVAIWSTCSTPQASICSSSGAPRKVTHALENQACHLTAPDLNPKFNLTATASAADPRQEGGRQAGKPQSQYRLRDLGFRVKGCSKNYLKRMSSMYN